MKVRTQNMGFRIHDSGFKSRAALSSFFENYLPACAEADFTPARSPFPLPLRLVARHGWLVAIFLLVTCHPSLLTASSTSGTGGGALKLRTQPAALTADFYVGVNGCDTCTGWGTLPAPNAAGTNGPFATLNQARKSVQGEPSGKHVVMIRGGAYFNTSVTFTSTDSGTSTTPIVYQNYPDETPTLIGGKLVTGWSQPGTGLCSGLSNCWQTAALSGFTNFESLYYNGQRRYRPRTNGGAYLYEVGPVSEPANPGPVCPPTGFPNCIMLQGTNCVCFDRMQFSGSDIASTYHNLNDVELYNFVNWDVDMLRLQSVDSTNHIVVFTGPTNTCGSTATSCTIFGFLANKKYLVENTEEKLNQPGQWYLDCGATACGAGGVPATLTYLGQNSSENPNVDVVIAPQQAQIIVATGLQYVTFKGLTFWADNYVVPAVGYASSSGQPNVSAALSFTTSSNVILDSDNIAHTTGWGVEFIGTAVASQGNQVINSALYDLGTGGIRLGKTPKSGDTSANVAQNNLVQNNVIEGIGRFIPGGEGPAVWMGSSHDDTVQYNDVYDTYSGGINLGISPNGGTTYTSNDKIQFNRMYNLGQGVTSDMGCVHTASSNNTGNSILNNVCHDVTHETTGGYGGDGIYIDQNSQNLTVQNNLVYRASADTFFNNDSTTCTSGTPPGCGNTISNNIFVQGMQSMVKRGGNEDSLFFSISGNIFYYDVGNVQKINPGYWACQTLAGSPVACTTRFSFDSNLYFNPKGTALNFVTTDVNTGAVTNHTLSDWQTNEGEDIHSINQNPLFLNPQYPYDNFTLLPQSLALAAPPLGINFAPFNPGQAGRTTPLVFPPSLPPAFPLHLLNPATDY